MFNFFKNDIQILAPVTGKCVALDKVNDPIFKDRLLGDGCAVLPEDGAVVSPISGVITMMFPTGHAFSVKNDKGIEVLVHIGLETVKANGEGFRILKSAGDKVEAGEAIVIADIELLRKKGFDTITPVVITSRNEFSKFEVITDKEVNGGADPVISCRL